MYIYDGGVCDVCVCVCAYSHSIILIMHHAFHAFHGFSRIHYRILSHTEREREREREIFHNFCKKSVYVVRIRFCWVDIEK